VNGEAVIENRREACGAQAFPEKANPNRPVLDAGSARRTLGDAGPYPEKCNPRGHRSPLTEDQRRLVVKYLPLAKAMARKIGLLRWEREELTSAAFLALVEAAQSFDPAHMVNFATFARHRIRGALSDCRRSWFRPAMDGNGVQSPVFCRLDPRDETHESVLCQETELRTGPEFEQIEALESYFRRLPRDQATACRLIYIDGKSQDEVAELLGYSKAYLSRLHRHALDALRRRCS
jgi:RNA polymerase sigma factor (sigma-70 family)